jgi:alpha-glucosidase (family GH31 glycosyl hydrolase)
LGNSLDIFIKSNYTKKPLISRVWPEKTLFPDFMNPKTSEFWNKGLTSLQNLVNFDGIWLDMNEPATILKNEKCLTEIADEKDCTKDKNMYNIDNLSYLPGYNGKENEYILAKRSISENALVNENLTVYDTRPLISYFEGKSTYDYLFNNLKIRPFILSRSTTIGSGKYVFHWLGDNYSEESNIKDSISGIFNFNIFGIPFTGADICGFHNDATDTICARWHNLAVIYPFTRNHNELTFRSQEPWMFNKIEYGDKENTLKSAKYAINLRYSLIRYIYTQLMLVSLGESGCYFKPVYFEFLWDNKLLDDNDILNGYVMAGKALYYIPNFSEDSEDYEGYFPNWNFNEFPSGKRIIDYQKDNNNGSVIKLNGGFQTINIFVKGGSIITYQDTFSEYIKSTEYLRQKPFDLIINPNENNLAYGDIIYDNDQIDVIENKDLNTDNMNDENDMNTNDMNDDGNNDNFNFYPGAKDVPDKYKFPRNENAININIDCNKVFSQIYIENENKQLLLSKNELH